MAVDSSSGAGWKWFEEKYGLTNESFEELLINNQENADNWTELVKDSPDLIKSFIEEIKIQKSSKESIERKYEIVLEEIRQLRTKQNQETVNNE